MRVLVVDDEPPVAGLIAEGLRNEGYDEVVTANSGEEALRIIAQARPDVVFLDLNMPGMDGTETLRRIREGLPDLPVVILSGWGTDRQVEAARALGVTDVLQKPTPLKNLSRTLDRLRQQAGVHASPYLVVLARHQVGLFDSLSRKFSGDPEFEVLLDRRLRERRRSAEPRDPERRRGADRRIQAADFLRLHGLGIIRQRQAPAPPFSRPR